MPRRHLFAFALAGLFASLAPAQTAPAPAAAFDAATIRPAAARPAGEFRSGLYTDPGRLRAVNMTLRDLIIAGYALKPYQLECPAWMSRERFDIQAETTAPLDRAEMIHRLRPFLERQFQLASHRQSKIMNLYALTVAGGGLKLQPAAAAGAGRDANQAGFNLSMAGPRMLVSGPATIARFVDLLSRQVDRPVVDKTGLNGTYAFHLAFAPTDQGAAMFGARPREQPMPPPLPSLPPCPNKPASSLTRARARSRCWSSITPTNSPWATEPMPRFHLSALVLAALLATLASAQTAPPPAAAFDAASIKPSAPPTNGRIRIGLSTDPGRLTASFMSLKDLIAAAYDLKPYQVVAPDWMSSARFDISAETAAAVPANKIVLLLQPFLEKQFQLVSHRETRTMDVYALVVAPGGLKWKPADASPPPPPPPGTPGRGRGGFNIRMSPKGMSMGGETDMSGFVDALAMFMDRPVLDQTGLTGRYQAQLDFAPTGEGMLARARSGLPLKGPGPGDETAPADTVAPSLFTALPEQAGLKLEARKGPVELMVIDQARKTPLGN